MEDVAVFYGPSVNFQTIGYILCTLVYFVVIWYIFPVLVYCTYHEKSGNPGGGGGETSALYGKLLSATNLISGWTSC
jgi:hypothetical protein